MKKTTRILTASTLLGLMASSAQAATVTNFTLGDGTEGTTLPTVSTTDLLQTSLAAGEGTAGNTEFDGGTVANNISPGNGINASWLGNDSNSTASGLTNSGATSLAGFVTDLGYSNAASLSDGIWNIEDGTSRGSALFQSGEYIEYTFDLTSATLGYDISGIDLYSNWGSGDGRNAINTVISYSLVATPTVFDQALISPGAFNPTPGTNTSGTQALQSITDLTASGVAGIRFDFPAQENGGVGYSELDVFGAATVPEPTTALLGGLGGLLLLRRRRA